MYPSASNPCAKFRAINIFWFPTFQGSRPFQFSKIKHPTPSFFFQTGSPRIPNFYYFISLFLTARRSLPPRDSESSYISLPPPLFLSPRKPAISLLLHFWTHPRVSLPDVPALRPRPKVFRRLAGQLNSQTPQGGRLHQCYTDGRIFSPIQC